MELPLQFFNNSFTIITYHFFLYKFTEET